LGQRLAEQDGLGTSARIALTNSLFLPDVVKTGLWKPERFVKTIGFRIFLTRPHQPGKTPVLLLHGYGGSPREMELVARGLESEKYEFWYAYYPTGAKLGDLAAALRSELAEVTAREGVPEVIIVGFSLGALVARGALALNQPEATRVTALIAIAAPWNGVPKAGQWSWLPGAPPCWGDLHPQSRFLTHLFDDPLPPDARLHVVYSTGDNIVDPGSLRRTAALAQASSITALPGKHSDPVFYRAARNRVRQLLDQTARAGAEDQHLARKRPT
jgi:pimeloyl-ACP methyl ester carboxylesterase